MQVGDLVFIKDETTPPSQWLMGRITETFPGSDGLTRSVKLRTMKDELKRPITKICLLPSIKEPTADVPSETGFPSFFPDGFFVRFASLVRQMPDVLFVLI